jgi:hypothetical protein
MLFPEGVIAECRMTDRNCNKDIRIGNNRYPWFSVCVQIGRNGMSWTSEKGGKNSYLTDVIRTGGYFNPC